MQSDQTRNVKALRAKLDHPVVDADGHLIEPQPLFHHYLTKVGGARMADQYRAELREHPTGSRGNRDTGDMRGAWWGIGNNAYDLATVMAPRLLHERLEEIGIDFAVMYPTLGLALPTIHDADVRRAACRALNTMNAEICGSFRDRLAPAAAIPMHTPAEAIEELEYAARLGLKVAMIPPGVARPIPELQEKHPEAFPNAAYFDNYGLDSFHDYDPVWRKFTELRMTVTSHGGVGLRYLPLGRRSPTNYMFNHIGGHSYQQGELCRSLIFGGVPARFPNLVFGFLECGAGWAVDLLHSLEEHWEKRNLEGLKNYDPSRLDRAAPARVAARVWRRRIRRRLGRGGDRAAPTTKVSRATIARRIATNGRPPEFATRRTSRDVREVFLRLRGRRSERAFAHSTRTQIPSARDCSRSSAPTSDIGTFPISRACCSRAISWWTREF